MPDFIIKDLGIVDYQIVFENMKGFSQDRDQKTKDELWIVEHNPVYTLGQAGDPKHLLQTNHIPLVQCDRGGQITYHGPGQVILYPLIDLRRFGLGIRQIVSILEETVIFFLKQKGIKANADPKAPGVYVKGKKIASLGLRVKKGCCYHGLAFNVDMDLAPFSFINPCGYQGLEVTQLSEVSSLKIDLDKIKQELINCFLEMISSDKYKNTHC